MRARAAVCLASVVAAVALAACGDDAKTTGSGEGNEPSGTSSVATTTAPTVTAKDNAVTVTTTPTATTGVPEGGVTQTQTQTQTTTTGTGESGEGGAGDEEPARVPVVLTHSSGKLSPTTVTVPAFLSLEIKLSGPATTATLPGGEKLTVPGTKTLTGLKPGQYDITTADGGKTTLNVVNGGDPGP